MIQIIELLIRILMMFLVVVALHGTALGDIPPLPPEIPCTEIELPTAPAVAIAGILLAIAVAAAGTMAGKAGSHVRKKIAMAVAFALVLATIGASMFAYREHSEHSRVRKNWRPLGPVERYDPDVLPDQSEEPAATVTSESSS